MTPEFVKKIVLEYRKLSVMKKFVAYFKESLITRASADYGVFVVFFIITVIFLFTVLKNF
jgi:hypothetical protein